MPKYHDYAVSSKKLQHWGLMFAYGAVNVTVTKDDKGDDVTTRHYDTFDQYADDTTSEITKGAAKEGANPNFYPAQGSIDVRYNTTYQEVVTAADNKKYYPKATFLDLKLRDGVFCPKGTYYTNVNQPTSVTSEVFTAKDFAKGIFTQADTYATRGAKITE